MRYHYEKLKIYKATYGKVYICDHPVYSRCTLYKIGEKGLAVLQQRYDIHTKSTIWTDIDPWLVDIIYLHERSSECIDGIYATVTIRQIMWALRMKPIKRERWETCFDRKNI